MYEFYYFDVPYRLVKINNEKSLGIREIVSKIWGRFNVPKGGTSYVRVIIDK